MVQKETASQGFAERMEDEIDGRTETVSIESSVQPRTFKTTCPIARELSHHERLHRRWMFRGSDGHGQRKIARDSCDGGSISQLFSAIARSDWGYVTDWCTC
eukprot:1761083-Rhodomonas_salina.11